MNPRELCQQGFKMSEVRNVNQLAINSLRLALKAYFSTYKTMQLYAIPAFEDDSEYKDIHKHQNYVEMYSETILHFQHFFELIIKDILRAKSEVLALKSDNQDLFIKLVLGEAVPTEMIEKQKTVEFDVAYKRLRSLVTLDPSSQYNFLVEQVVVETLNELTNMRNRIWHRGSFILRYHTLDLFVGKYVLPIVQKVMQTDQFNGFNRWKGSSNRLGIDIIEAIILEANKDDLDLSKIAFFKELGRASYNNELVKGFGIIKDEVVNRATNLAEKEIENTYAQGTVIFCCPSCGVSSLVGYQDTELEYEDDGSVIGGSEFIYQVKCHHCDFELRNLGMKNLKDYGFENEDDYWLVKEL